MPLHSPWLPRPSGEGAVLGGEQGERFVRNELSTSVYLCSVPPVPGDSRQGNLQVMAGGCSREECGMCLCVSDRCAGRWVTSGCSACWDTSAPQAAAVPWSGKWQKVAPKREIPSLHRRCKWTRTTPSPRWPGCPGASEAAVPKDRGDEVLLILCILFTRFRSKMTAAGFTISGKDHPICPVMLGDARLAAVMAEDMLNRGIYVIGFSYPVVPKGKARIRVQISAVHSDEDIDRCVEAFTEVGRKHGALP
uniref:Aminotransferase class I/classII large domain-containing protein n=1 Tax=Buteo japonicus TaxID=224669 RepID=A0A8B9Z828_9AVES